MKAFDLVQQLETAFVNKTSEMQIIVELLILYNLRVSEVLQLRKSAIIHNRFVIIQGLKNSADIIVRDRILVEEIICLAQERTDKLFLFSNYNSVYRFVKENFSSVINTVKKKKNFKVTHCFRYLNTHGFTDAKSIKALLHHNSIKSNSFYTNKLMEDSHGNN